MLNWKLLALKIKEEAVGGRSVGDCGDCCSRSYQVVVRGQVVFTRGVS